MTIKLPICHRHCFPTKIINHAVWAVSWVQLEPRDVELLLAEHGIFITHETIRRWSPKFGSEFAGKLRRRRRTLVS